MAGRRVLVIGVDGLDVAFAERLMANGEMPALAALRQRAVRFRLDHGPAQRTGLAWEHVACGLSSEDGRRWAAVEFDPTTYRAWQEGARFAPWWAAIDRRVVVFDTPYVHLRRAPTTRGIVGWGAHDPGTLAGGRPSEVLDEFWRRFGVYPFGWTYGTPWPSAALTRKMGDVLTRALDTRTRAARWLAMERLPDWDLFIAVAGEVHGAVEGLWHGVDPRHPLHGHPSAAEAARALLAVHRAQDRMIGELVRSAGDDATIVAFTMGGMGPNHSDVQSMVLLPELLYRDAFGQPLLSVPRAWSTSPAEVPLLDEDESWAAASATWFRRSAAEILFDGVHSFVSHRPKLLAMARTGRAAVASWRSHGAIACQDLRWQPTLRYQPHWPRMRAFALPSFYDGRIRINLRGRERHGIVDPSRYEDTCRAIERLVAECRNARTGEPAVRSIDRAWTRDPLALGGSESDLLVVWRDAATALLHPRLGLIGPVPLRRTGGHTGPHGMAYITGPGLEAGERGVRSSFDVVPTLVDLLGCGPISGMSGGSLLGTS